MTSEMFRIRLLRVTVNPGTLLFLLAVIIAGGTSRAADWTFLDNGEVKLGVNTNAGACIGFFGESATGRNLLNHWDEGRYLQQSWYGRRDDSLWNKKPWVWNPVQGGSWRGKPSRLLEFRHTTSNLFARVTPRHWASGVLLTNVEMISHIRLEGRLARIRFDFAYRGDTVHQRRSQEMPAVFVDAALPNLVYHDGERPWRDEPLSRRVPGWPNEHAKLVEPWAAYVDDQDWGVGLMSPGSTTMTCYRFGGPQGPNGSGCSYFAPVQHFRIRPGFRHSYTVCLTVGSVKEIRARFRREALRTGKAE